MGKAQVSLPEAAFRLAMSYQRTYRLLLVGELRGDREEGHWRVDSASLDAMVKKQPARRMAAA